MRQVAVVEGLGVRGLVPAPSSPSTPSLPLPSSAPAVEAAAGTVVVAGTAVGRTAVGRMVGLYNYQATVR